MSIGSYTLILNEATWIGPCVSRVIPFIDEMVYFDGGSTDGTLEILHEIKSESEHGHKLKIFEGKNPKDLQDDYVKLSNECLHSLSTDFAIFLHPDMWVKNPEQFLKCRSNPALAMSVKMTSFAGEPDSDLYQIKGRSEVWKNIIRLKNPSLGAHYWGHYGSANEDCYFSEITGDEHILYANMSDYPYEVVDSGLEIYHFSDVRPLKRRIERMRRCLLNQGRDPSTVGEIARNHPRVTLKSGSGFEFTKTEYPKEFIEARERYAVKR